MSSLHALARCSEAHSERDVDRVARKFKLAIPIPLHSVDIGKGVMVDILRMTSWAKWLLQETNLGYTLTGQATRNAEHSERIWADFWQNYASIHPAHPIFSRAANDKEFSLSRTYCLALHGDEGRTRKKSAVMILSCHSILGLGSRPSEHKKGKGGLLGEMKVNCVGSTMTTRHLLSILPRSYYDDSAEGDPFETLVEHIVGDLNQLYWEGVVGLDGKRYFFIVTHLMGDWPFLNKLGKFTRSFANVAKAESSKTICHVCCADMEGYPWEDFESPEPKWRSTLNTLSPFPEDPPAVLRLVHDTSDDVGFFAQDLFHAWHIGAGKVHLGSMIALATSLFPGRGVDARFEAITAHLLRWAKERKVQIYIRKLTKECIHWSSTNQYPVGGWSKGSTTLALTRWMLHLC